MVQVRTFYFCGVNEGSNGVKTSSAIFVFFSEIHKNSNSIYKLKKEQERLTKEAYNPVNVSLRKNFNS